ncbi:hypothetical protein JTB14_007871 [Gonioctena quinquepunctata]|nr:hypothetical protein JTB14_007871 [Gonioctena quinquepunctata]
MGLSPPKKVVAKVFYLLLAIPHIFACSFLLILLSCADLLTTEKTFKETMYGMSVLILNSIVVIRTTFWFFTRSKFEKIKKILRRKTFSFVSFNLREIDKEYVLLVRKNKEIIRRQRLSYGEIGALWRDAILVFDENCNELETFRQTKMFQTRMFCCFINIALTFFSTMTVLLAFGNEFFAAEEYEASNPYLNRTSIYRKYLTPIYLPFDLSLDGYYWLGYFFSFYAHLGNVYIFMPIEVSLTCSFIHLISQTAVLKEAFSYVDKNVCQNGEQESINTIKEYRIVKCMNELQQIYR